MEPESSYRRGTVFGLTVAEIFILLIFLILLALLGLANHWREKEKEYENERIGREQLLDEWRDIIEFRRPDEIRTLIRTRPELVGENEDLRGENTTLSREKEKLREERDALRTERDELQEQLEPPGRDTDPKQNEVQTLQEDLKSLQRDNEDLRGENATLSREKEKLREERDALRTERDGLQDQLETARRYADDARKELRILRHKGENPPCWYETVAAGEGRMREKAHYLFDIAVYDEAMVVLRRPPPAGRAEDDGGPLYAVEARDLGLDRIPYDTFLSDAQVEEVMRSIHDRGKAGEVRSYSCIFSVKVWDKTSPDAKARWQHAHDRVLEGLFGTYVAQDDPWPGAP